MSLGSAFLFCFYCRKLRDQPRSTLVFSLVSSEKLYQWCVGLFSFLQTLFQEQHHQVEKKIFSLVFYSQDRHRGILDLVSYHNSSFPYIPSFSSCCPCAEKSRCCLNILWLQTMQPQSPLELGYLCEWQGRKVWSWQLYWKQVHAAP